MRPNLVDTSTNIPSPDNEVEVLMSYDEILDNQFKNLPINLVVHDTSPTGLPCYIEVHLGNTPRDKGTTVLDLGNYIYRRFGLKYQMCPEYRGEGKKTTVRWFMSWDDVQLIRPNIFKAAGCDKRLLKHREFLPFGFQSLIIQDTSRSVYPPIKGQNERP